MTISDKTVSQEKLNDFMLKVASDFGAAWKYRADQYWRQTWSV